MGRSSHPSIIQELNEFVAANYIPPAPQLYNNAWETDLTFPIANFRRWWQGEEEVSKKLSFPQSYWLLDYSSVYKFK